MNSTFHIWLTGTSSWLQRGKQAKCTQSREEASEYTLDEAIERCCLVMDGRPIATMVPVSPKIVERTQEAHFVCSWEARLAEIKSSSLARGIIEGIAVTTPEISDKLKEAAGYLSGSCKTPLGDDGGSKPHEIPPQSQTSHGGPS